MKFELPVIVQGNKKTNLSGALRNNTQEYAENADDLAQLLADWIIMDAVKSYLELHVGTMSKGKVEYHDPESAMTAHIEVSVSVVHQGMRGCATADMRKGNNTCDVEVLLCPAHLSKKESIESILQQTAPEANIVVRGTGQKTRADSPKPGVAYSSYFVARAYSDLITPVLEGIFNGLSGEKIQVMEPRYRGQ